MFRILAALVGLFVAAEASASEKTFAFLFTEGSRTSAHGTFPAGTSFSLLPGDCSATASKAYRYQDEVVEFDATELTIGNGCAATGKALLAVVGTASTFGPVPLEPVPGDEAARTKLDERARAPGGALDRSFASGSEYRSWIADGPPTFRRAAGAGASIVIATYPSRARTRGALVIASDPPEPLQKSPGDLSGCNRLERAFTLDGALYLVATFGCCECGVNVRTILRVPKTGSPVIVHSNADWST